MNDMKCIFGILKKKLRNIRKILSVHRAWNRVSKKITYKKIPNTSTRILIFPCDLRTIVGSIGDNAMLNSLLDHNKNLNPDIVVHMLCRDSAVEIVKNKGFEAVVLPWLGLNQFPEFFSQLFASNEYAELFILGADIMDGYYGLDHPAMALMAADIAVKHGTNATILGASFNNHPQPELARFFNKIDARVRLNMRDQTSFERLAAFSKVSATLVADAAFMLKPGNVPKDVENWVGKQRSENRILLGINVHPMLIKKASESDVAKLVSSTVQALNLTQSERSNLSYLLIPHDYRGEDGDARCLKPIFEQLKNNNSIRCFYLEGEHAAADLKAIAGLLDGVITGRMHLAIASLGMGVPVLSLTYQDKFEGLYRHFDLPKSLLLSIEYFDEPEKLADQFIRFVDHLDSLRQQVKDKKPRVIELSEKNFIS